MVVRTKYMRSEFPMMICLHTVTNWIDWVTLQSLEFYFFLKFRGNCIARSPQQIIFITVVDSQSPVYSDPFDLCNFYKLGKPLVLFLVVVKSYGGVFWKADANFVKKLGSSFFRKKVHMSSIYINFEKLHLSKSKIPYYTESYNCVTN